MTLHRSTCIPAPEFSHRETEEPVPPQGTLERLLLRTEQTGWSVVYQKCRRPDTRHFFNTCNPVGSGTFLDKSRPQLLRPWITQLDALPALPALVRDVSDCVNSANLDISRHLRVICSVHGYPAQRPTSTCCPRPGRIWLRELRESFMDWSPIVYGLESAKPDLQSTFKKPGGDTAAG